MVRSSPRHALLLLLCACLALNGCWCGGPGRVDSAVTGVPVTMKQVEALHDPPRRTVTVTRESVSRGGGGGACAHHPVCLIVVPVVLVSALFPEKYDHVVIREGEQVTYEARFTTEGRLLDATVTEADGGTRLLRGLHMEALGRTQVVEHARIPRGAKEAILTPLLSQVDLPGEYRAAMKTAGSGALKAKLLVEALAVLGRDAEALMVERLADPAEADEAKLEVLTRACDTQQAFPAYTPFKEPALKALEKGAGPLSGLEALRCTKGGTPEAGARRGAFTRAVARALCDPATPLKEGGAPLAGLVAEGEVKAALSVEDARACAEPLTREVLRALLGDKATGAELDAAFASSRPEKRVLTSRLDATLPGHRGALLRAVAAGTLSQESLGVVREARPRFSATEVDLLAQALLTERKGFFATRSCSSDLVALLASAPPSSRGPARRRLRELLPTLGNGGDRAVARVGLVLLGEREHALPAARELETSFDLRDSDRSLPACVARGLVAAGCTEQELRELAKLRPRPEEDARGPLCTRAAVAGASVP